MYGFKLVVNMTTIYYYDDNELEVALYDQSIYGGVIYDRRGKCIA